MRKQMREYENLCMLGLPTRDLVPLALGLLERIVGGSLFAFIWADKRFQAVDAYLNESVPDAFTRVYAEEFYNRREAEVGPTFSDILSKRIPLVNFSSLGARMFDSALYAEVFRPAGMRHALRASVIDGEHRHGMFAITRPAGMGFSSADERIIIEAARNLAHAFELERTGKLVRSETVEGADEGFFLLGADGRIQYGCDVGLRLFYDATRADGVGQQAAAIRETLPAALAAQARSGRRTGESVVANNRGEFVFRPFLMRSPDTPGDAPVAVTVRRRGSMSTRLWQESARFGLSVRERQIVVLLALGQGYEDIAERLAVSRNTVVSYVRRAYEKLGISQRDQLVHALLASLPG